MLEYFQIPPKFRSMDLEFMKRLEPYIPPRRWSKAQFFRGLYVSGSCGIGKTVALTGIAKEWYRLWAREVSVPSHTPGSHMPLRFANSGHWVWRFVSVPAFVMKLQYSFAKDGDDRALDLLNEIAGTPFLILDDLGAEKATEFVRQSIYFLLNEREIHGRPTLITSNVSPVRLNEQLDSRISSRIAGMCDIKEWTGRDLRLHPRSGGAGELRE